jgi:hypothetical protein
MPEVKLNRTSFDNCKDAYDSATDFFDSISSEISKNAKESDLVQFSIDNEIIRHPVELPFIVKKDFKLEKENLNLILVKKRKEVFITFTSIFSSKDKS